MAKQTTVDRLETAKAALVDANRQLADMEVRRNAALLKDDDKQADKLLAEIEQQRRAIRGATDKIGLLQAEAENEAAAQRAKEKAALISKIESRYAERNAAAAELTLALEQAAGALNKLVNIGAEINMAWSWPASYLTPLLLTVPAITAVVANEMQRISAPEVLLGDMDKGGTRIKLPGSKAPSITSINNPASIKPLGALMEEATRLASELMRTGRLPGGQVLTPSAIEGVPVGLRADRPDLSGPEAKLAKLLSQQATLALDASEQGEVAYGKLMEQISAVSAEVEAAKQQQGEAA